MYVPAHVLYMWVMFSDRMLDGQSYIKYFKFPCYRNKNKRKSYEVKGKYKRLPQKGESIVQQSI